MRVVIQRVSSASVTVDNRVVSAIKNGFLVLVGLHRDDTAEQSIGGFNPLDHLIKKMMNLRVFPDSEGKMNLSLVDKGYEVLLVSQFTLYADCRKGNRPSFVQAMPPGQAKEMYQKFVERFKDLYVADRVHDGIFGAMMDVALVNDGPVTIVLEA